jgi:hypothetical protein
MSLATHLIPSRLLKIPEIHGSSEHLHTGMLFESLF